MPFRAILVLLLLVRSLSFLIIIRLLLIKNSLLFVLGPVMFHVRRRPNDNSAQAQAARRRKKKLSGSGGSLGGGGSIGGPSSSNLANRAGAGGQSIGDSGSLHSPDDQDRCLPYLVELNPDGSEARQGGVVRRHLLVAAVTEVGSERPAPSHPSSPIAGNNNIFHQKTY